MVINGALDMIRYDVDLIDLCSAFSLLLYQSGMAVIIDPLVFALVISVTSGNGF